MDMIGGELGFMAASAGQAFLTLMEPHRLMFLGLGCIMGLVLGIIPGIGGLTGTAMLLPFTFNMDPYAAFALLLGLGATTATGDPIPAVLFGVACAVSTLTFKQHYVVDVAAGLLLGLASWWLCFRWRGLQIKQPPYA